MDTIKGFFGMKTAAQKQAEAAAQATQGQQGRAAESDAAQLAMQQSSSDRIARAAGQRTLAFNGNGAGLPSTLGG